MTLRLVPSAGAAGADPVETLATEVAYLQAELAAARGAAGGHRNLAKQWRTFAAVLVKRLGGDVTVTEQEIADFLTSKSTVRLDGLPQDSAVRMVIAAEEPPAAPEAPPAPQAATG